MAARAKAKPARGGPEIRAAKISDAKSIAMLVTALGYPTNAADMKARLQALLSDATYTTLLAQVSGEVVGMAGACVARFYEKNGLYVRLVALVVSESSSGKGVGAALVRAVESWATEQGASEIFLNSGVQREGAHSFYEKLGYRESGVRFSKELA
jgi:GNAT superfamily N-acetyltransferase